VKRLIARFTLASEDGLVIFFAVSCLAHRLLPSPARLASNPVLLILSWTRVELGVAPRTRPPAPWHFLTPFQAGRAPVHQVGHLTIDVLLADNIAGLPILVGDDCLRRAGCAAGGGSARGADSDDAGVVLAVVVCKWALIIGKRQEISS
jgi:hypothetical protein